MQTDFGHWAAMRSAMRDEPGRRKVDRRTLRRIAVFARPHSRAWSPSSS